MKLYYTTVGEALSSQNKPSQSLGGYCSNSIVPNNTFDNLFGELSLNTIRENRDEYIGLMLVNDSSNTIEGINIYFEREEDSYSIYKIQAVTPATDEDGNPFIETIPNRFSRPLYVDELVEPTIEDPLFLGNLSANEMIGVWVKRELREGFINEDSNDIIEQDPSNQRRYISKAKSNQDIFSIIISWD